MIPLPTMPQNRLLEYHEGRHHSTPTVSRCIHVTLPDYVYEALERWSDQQGRPLANLGAFLIEVAIVKAIKEGGISPPLEPRSTNPPHK